MIVIPLMKYGKSKKMIVMLLMKYGRGKKMNNSEMTRDEIWGKIIKDLKTLDQEAHEHYEDFVPIFTRLLVMTAE